MNKQELIERINKLPCSEGPIACTVTVNREWILNSIEQLDQPQKVTVPQFVADWIEYCKENNYTLFGCLDPVNGFENLAGETFEGDVRKCIRWCRKESNNFARAWLDGYEVEKEPKYTVKCKSTKQYLSNDELGPHFDPSFRSNFTKSDLEELGLGWVFDCPGMEVEEVE